jgi:hypothetical protein
MGLNTIPLRPIFLFLLPPDEQQGVAQNNVGYRTRALAIVSLLEPAGAWSDVQGHRSMSKYLLEPETIWI